MDNQGEDMTPIQMAASEGHVSVVVAILESGERVDLSNRVGTPVQLAASRGHHNIVRLLRLHFIKVGIMHLTLLELHETKRVLLMNKMYLSSYGEESSHIASRNDLAKKVKNKKEKKSLRKETNLLEGDISLDVQAVRSSYLLFWSVGEVEAHLSVIGRRIEELQ